MKANNNRFPGSSGLAAAAVIDKHVLEIRTPMNDIQLASVEEELNSEWVSM